MQAVAGALRAAAATPRTASAPAAAGTRPAAAAARCMARPAAPPTAAAPRCRRTGRPQCIAAAGPRSRCRVNSAASVERPVAATAAGTLAAAAVVALVVLIGRASGRQAAMRRTRGPADALREAPASAAAQAAAAAAAIVVGTGGELLEARELELWAACRARRRLRNQKHCPRWSPSRRGSCVGFGEVCEQV